MAVLKNVSKVVFSVTPGGVGGMEWPIDPLSEGNCESFEYILLLVATGSVLP